MDKSDCNQFWNILKDLFLVISAVAGIIIAFFGLKTWQKQLVGKTKYELARRLLKEIYRTRDNIKNCRNIFFSIDELREAQKKHGVFFNTNDSNFFQKSQYIIYSMRWRAVEKSLSNLMIEKLEAETVWGKEINTLINQFLDLINDLEQKKLIVFNENLAKKFEEKINDFQKIIYQCPGPRYSPGGGVTIFPTCLVI